MRKSLQKPKQKPKNETKSLISSTQKAFMYACLIPVFGSIPALMALISDRGSKQLKDVAQISLIMVLVWLSGYGVLGDGNQITQELSKASLTSIYFVLNMFLMWRLSQGKKVSLPRLNRPK
jgi:hypothetical protein